VDIIRGFLVFVEVVTCVLLVCIILLQKSKGGGMGLAFGAGVGEALFGAQAGNILTKTTAVLAVVFLVNTTILSLMGAGQHRAATKSLADKIAPAAAQPMNVRQLPSQNTGTEAPSGGMPAGQLPLQGIPSSVDQPAAPVPPAPVTPVKPETAPVVPASTGTSQTPSK